jgi:predicted nucleic acid-binding protein
VDRLFLDANILFSAAYREKAPLRRLWHETRAQLLTSTYALVEAERHLAEEQRRRLAELMQKVEIVADVPAGDLPGGVALPEKDAPILAAAIASGATHLITGDRRDFGALYGERIGGVLVLPPRDYLGASR